MVKHLSSEMIKWLNYEYWHNCTRFVPVLTYEFMREFGYKRTNTPDSMKIEEASNYVGSWINLYDMKRHFPNYCPPK